MTWNLPYVFGWLSILLVLFGYELFALLDRNAWTPSLTATTVRYVPWWVTLPFVAWLFVHFALRYFNSAYVERLRGHG